MGITADVAVFPCALRYGALFRDFGDESLRRYAGEVERLTGGCGLFGPLRAFVVMDFGACDKGGRVVRDDDVDERLMYYMVCALAPAAPFFEVDVAAVRPMLNIAGEAYRCRSARWRMWSGCMGVSCPWRSAHGGGSRCVEQVAVFGCRAADSVGMTALQRWRRISSTGAIVAACGAEYRKAVRVVGEVLCATDFAVGDGFLQRRIVALLRAGRLSARGPRMSERMRRAIAAAGYRARDGRRSGYLGIAAVQHSGGTVGRRQCKNKRRLFSATPRFASS